MSTQPAPPDVRLAQPETAADLDATAGDVAGQLPAIVTPDQLAAWLGVDPKTLETWRYGGGGPPWFKVGRTIRYRVRAVAEWIETQERAGACAPPLARTEPARDPRRLSVPCADDLPPPPSTPPVTLSASLRRWIEPSTPERPTDPQPSPRRKHR